MTNLTQLAWWISMKQEEQRQWYVVYSKPNREEYARYHLQRKGIEVFFPQLQLPVPRVKQRHTIPLFPSYLFVQLCLPGEHCAVLWCPGVKCLVSFNGTPAPLDDQVVQFLKEQATTDGIIGAFSTLSVGQEVCVIKGPFEGLKGIIQNPPDAKGRIRLLMHLLNRDLSVTLPMYHVNGDWTVTRSETKVPQADAYVS